MASIFHDSDDLNDSPVIGILAQPWVISVKNPEDIVVDYCQNPYFPTRQYLASSYVKFLESSGARVIPINYWSTRQEIECLFKKINGLLLPGGDGAYPPQIAMIIDVAVKMNENGTYFPVWGTCLGLQYISTYFGLKNGWTPDSTKNETNFNFLEYFPVLNQSNKLHFTPQAKEHSRWYHALNPSLHTAAETEGLTANFHNYGVSAERFEKFLAQDCLLVATAYADVPIVTEKQESTIILQKGDQIVEKDSLDSNSNNQSTKIHKKLHITQLEHKKYPIYAVQFHPERTLFEWGYEANGEQYQKISRSRNAILLAQHSASFFTFECRKNKNTFKNIHALHSKLIYNFIATRHGKGIVEMYFFDHWYPSHLCPCDEDEESPATLKQMSSPSPSVENTKDRGDNKSDFPDNTKVNPPSAQQSAASLIS